MQLILNIYFCLYSVISELLCPNMRLTHKISLPCIMIAPKVLDLLAIEVPIIIIKLRTFGAAISIAASE